VSVGAFRDASAAIERAAMLEQENEQLREEVGALAKLQIELEELTRLRVEVAQLRAAVRGENETAYVKRLGEERDELTVEVRALRERLAVQERELSRLRRRRSPPVEIESAFERLIRLFRPK
jgi:regulator of replication initiation timing